jgi:hypothetical protein
MHEERSSKCSEGLLNATIREFVDDEIKIVYVSCGCDRNTRAANFNVRRIRGYFVHNL